MSIGWILGLAGGGVSLAAIAAAIAFFAPQMWAPILETLQAALKAVVQAARWLVFTAEGRQVLLACTTVLAFWWSGQRGWDRRGDWQAAQERAATAHAAKIGKTFVDELSAADTKIKLDLSAGEMQIDDTFANIAKEVPSHVTPEIDRRYPVPCGLIRMWDAGYYRVDPAALASGECASDAARAPVRASALSAEGASLWGDYWRLKKHDDAVMQMYAHLVDGYEKMRAQLVAINSRQHT